MSNTKSPSQEIDDIIKLYGGWKGKTIAELRSVILSAAPNLEEQVKWRMKSRPEGLPVWEINEIVCLIETFKNDLKLVFYKGAQMKDSGKMFNARLMSKDTRAIEFTETTKVDPAGIKALVREAVQLNLSK